MQLRYDIYFDSDLILLDTEPSVKWQEELDG